MQSASISLFLVCLTVLALVPDMAVSVFSQTKRPRQARPRAKATQRSAEFPHNVKAHSIACSSCHKFPSTNWNKVRPAADAFPDITEYPRHESCLNCHRQQFFKGARPAICSVCHTAASPKGSPRHPFPNPREIFDLSAKGKNARSDFEISFPHDKHIDIVSAAGATRSPFRNAAFPRARAAEESCSVCHKTLQPQGDTSDEYVTKPPVNLGEGFWLKKGTFKTVPTSHATCFTCHSQESGLEPAPTSCSTCHKIRQHGPAGDFDAKLAARMGSPDRITLDAWRKRDSSGKFRHEWVSHADLSCDTCHNVQTMNTVDFRTKKVGISSCGTCHATATSAEGGALNLELDSRKANPTFQCTKCHIVFATRPMPEPHTQPTPAAGGKSPNGGPGKKSNILGHTSAALDDAVCIGRGSARFYLPFFIAHFEQRRES